MPEFNTKISSPLPTYGPMDCPDVTLVFHINVSLLYMLFPMSLLKCYFVTVKAGEQLGYMYEHMARDGSLDVVNLLTISADTKVSLHGQLSCAPI